MRCSTEQRTARTAFVSCVVGLCVLLALAGCASADPPTVLEGSVLDAYTGQPVSAADVTIGETNLTTDDAGAFTTTDWTREDALQIAAPSYEPISTTIKTELADTEAQTVTLETALRPNTLSGVITDDYSGDPIAGATVSATGGDASAEATTDDAGRYTLEGVPAEFTLDITAPDYAETNADLEQTTAYDAALQPSVITGVVTDQYSNQPIAGVTVAAGDASATTDDAGRYRIEGVTTDKAIVEISAQGYAPLSQELTRNTELDAELRPDILKSVLVDAESGEPVINAAIVAKEKPNSAELAFTRIEDSADGSFTLEGMPESGIVEVLAPGYRKATIEIKPGNIPAQIELEPFYVKALYVTAAVASSPSYMEEFFDLVDSTELNTIIVDIKSDLRDDLGLVYYDSQTPMAKELGTTADYVDMPGLVAKAKERGIYIIARVQVFSHDNALADARPDWAIQDLEDGGVLADYPGPNIRYAWLDPTNENVREYNLELSLEAAQMGFDEINFDYIRFPDWSGDLADYTKAYGFSKPVDPVNDPDGMYNTIADFLEQAHRQINGSGAFFSIDVFGRTMVAPSMPISQNLAVMGEHTDYIAPMPYPSLWWSGYLGFDNPTAHPYEVIAGSVNSGAEFMKDSYALMRPWLQDHTDPWQGSRVVEYGPAEVRAQIDAAEDTGKTSGWMLYDSANTYTEGALKPAP